MSLHTGELLVMKMNRKLALLTGMLCAAIFASCAADIRTKKAGNIEVVEQVKGDVVIAKLVYTYEGERRVRGEYWELIDPKDKKDEKKSETNIFTGTSIAQKYEASLAGGGAAPDTSGVALNSEKDGYVLKFVKIVKYNAKGQPDHVMNRGFSKFPIVGFFQLKTDYKYKYDAAGRLTHVLETNMNVDSLLLNMAASNTTTIERDTTGRPVKITRNIGSVPPAVETTTYAFYGKTPNMLTTVYKKAGFDMSKGTVVVNESITTLYGEDVPWEGMKKFEFGMGKNLKGIRIYDEVNKKDKLDASKFSEMSKTDQLMMGKSLFDLYKNEMKGPRWRMGDLPDVPQPFLEHKDNVWFK